MDTLTYVGNTVKNLILLRAGGFVERRERMTVSGSYPGRPALVVLPVVWSQAVVPHAETNDPTFEAVYLADKDIRARGPFMASRYLPSLR